ncbi:hypothetical protein V6N12_030368 [Hibiscus sabdariffa]|uniref:Uncharacterized protein n=1 Tax=Hibiscus sabdariffa TaxID=183260 RepID=A0ABR2C0U6_9ROSI
MATGKISMTESPSVDEERPRGYAENHWLVSVATALWVLWCARNDNVFNRKASTIENCMFQAKLIALFWLKTAKGKDFDELDGWWSSPRSGIVAFPVRCRHFGANFKFMVVVHMSIFQLLRAIFSGGAMVEGPCGN